MKLRGVTESALLGYQMPASHPPNTIAKNLCITSGTPGTTRDLIRAEIDLGGVVVEFIDTAGIRKILIMISKGKVCSAHCPPSKLRISIS
ncbi:MAG: hypothetical protein CM15mP86_17270 [Gammaproteobacteria bacterium]|nr:MAG: hypothetical protein CM15mP86_17270 [Gammaproteobacteria bacterium]